MKNLSEHSVPHKERVTSHSVSHLLMSLPPEATVRVGEATVSAPGLQAFDGGLAELNSVKPEARGRYARSVTELLEARAASRGNAFCGSRICDFPPLSLFDVARSWRSAKKSGKKYMLRSPKRKLREITLFDPRNAFPRLAPRASWISVSLSATSKLPIGASKHGLFSWEPRTRDIKTHDRDF